MTAVEDGRMKVVSGQELKEKPDRIVAWSESGRLGRAIDLDIARDA